jgi:hypothetical protein
MKPARRIGFILAAMLMVTSFVGVPAIAQQDEAAALDKRAGELYQAGKFSEAIPLARRSLAIYEKACQHSDRACGAASAAISAPAVRPDWTQLRGVPGTQRP